MTDPFVRSGVLKVREMIRDGTLGDITGAHFQLASHAAYEKDESYPIYDRSLTLGGIVADSCGHMLHMAYFLFGKPNSLCAALAPVTSMAKKNKIEENAHIILRYSGGLLVVLDNSWVSGGAVKRIAVYGSEGNAFVTELSHIEGDENLKICRPDGSEQNLSGNDLPENPTQHVRYWLRMIHEGLPNSIVGQDPLSNSGVGIDSAVDLVEMIEAIYHSAEENCFVELT